MKNLVFWRSSTIALIGIGLAFLGWRAFADERIASTPIGPNMVKYRIDEPNVRQPSTDYQSLVFKPGDRVTINAGGCVQTGGHGRTWKRYVNPGGSNSDRLYHGLIWIPGATGSLVRIQSVIGRTLTIPLNIGTADLFLRLGYEDDGYGDNSYKDHDDGTDDQCKNVGAAWVELTVEHKPNDTTTAPPPLPFDLSLAPIDDNFLPINAKWGWQITNPGQLPDPEVQCAGQPDKNPCTNQATSRDSWSFICGPHANWFPATYEGTLSWESHSAPIKDDDYNLRLKRDDKAALTKNDETKGQLLEFSSDETIDHFKTPWWDGFHKAVDKSDAAAHALVDGRFAIVTGLVGLDCEHSCGSELHPVYAMAIRVKDDPSDEVWAIMVRNWGNEGFCSSDQHLLPLKTFSFRLPWRAGATQVTSVQGTQFLSNDPQASGPSMSAAVNQGVLASFTMSDPHEDGTRINGELHLRWSAPAGISMRLPIRAIPPGPVTLPVETEDDAEAKFGALVTNMPKQARTALLANIAKKNIAQDQTKFAAKALVSVSNLPALNVSRLRTTQIRTQAVPAIRWVKHRQQLLKAVCAAYGGKLEGFPAGACDGVK